MEQNTAIVNLDAYFKMRKETEELNKENNRLHEELKLYKKALIVATAPRIVSQIHHEPYRLERISPAEVKLVLNSRQQAEVINTKHITVVVE